MAPFLFFLLFLFSSATACHFRCINQSKVAYFSKASQLSTGACGYGSRAVGFNAGYIAAANPSIYHNGAGCGACFQIRCKDEKLCTSKGTTVIVTDLNTNNQTDFVLSSRAFAAMAKNGRGQDILKLGIVDVEYKRVPCEYKNQNLAVRVEESSKYPDNLAITLLYQGGMTEVVAMDVAEVGAVAWSYLLRSKSQGAVWNTSRVPPGALQFRMVVTEGYDGAWVWAQHVLPENWKPGVIYDSGVQITAVAQEHCSTCDDGIWK